MKVLALTTDGRLTYCSASPENIGKGKCNHVLHQNKNESNENFAKRIAESLLKKSADNYRKEVLSLNISEKLKMIENHKNLDILVDDENYTIRAAVAEQGYGLDKLIDDKNWRVRTAVAEQGYGLDKLVNDEIWIVREAVAKQGYGLKKLINDKNKNVRKAAKYYKIYTDR